MGRVGDVERVVIEGRQRTDDAAHHGHGMGIETKARVKARQLVVHLAVPLDVADEIILLGGRRQFTVQQQVAQLQEIRAFGKLLDGISAMQEDAFIAIDVGDVRIAGSGGDEAGIVSEIPLVGEFAHIDHGRTDTCGMHWQLDRIP